MNNELNLGDVVYLNSRPSLLMTVAEIFENRIGVVFWNEAQGSFDVLEGQPIECFTKYLDYVQSSPANS